MTTRIYMYIYAYNVYIYIYIYVVATNIYTANTIYIPTLHAFFEMSRNISDNLHLSNVLQLTVTYI